MIYALIDALIEALLRAVGWVASAARGVVLSSTADAAASAAEELSFDKAKRRSTRRRMRRMAADGDVQSLVSFYHRCGAGPHNRDLRLDALTMIAKADADAAEPLLHDVITGPNDAWMVMGALDIAGRHGLHRMSDTVTTACEDPRPAVSTTASLIQKRLRKAAPSASDRS